MQGLISEILERVKADRQCIILLEGMEERTLKAANQILTDDIANSILLNNPVEINACTTEWGLGNIPKATIIDPENNPKQKEYTQLLLRLREKKDMTIEEARKLVTNLLCLGCLVIKNGDTNGQLAGARNTTGDVPRPVLQIVKTASDATYVSSAMLLLTHAPECGKNGVLVIGDAAVTPVPGAFQLARTAACTVYTAKTVAGFNPKVALLSSSMKGSIKHKVVSKVVGVLKVVKELAPDTAIDGELQADTALAPEIGASKALGSAITSNVNVLVAPSLEVDNASYELVQRLGHVDVVGPILRGIVRPVNDLLRGCSIEDVYCMIVITVNQTIVAKHNK